ncbi:fluoride efflux transporter CrcB [Thermobifida halotolerans]|uniref:Fluoride-specific ion channel FluC n=1 Tax=Thermobifida halotolerans TaxID=483545 RepID=A0A399FUE3_9ACTN|nr:fluoride efflux transporter CrcB [Thermobifida halotolerans]UOE18893.1 fluoride efflux transporter CrcB [Thermobifida halotolerans]
MTALLVAVGAAVGAPLRYLLDRVVQARHGSALPWGTWCVNTLGCLLIGVLTALPLPAAAVALLGTGLCGALTTYSTFGYETLRLLRGGARWHALLNAGANLAAGLGAAFVGMTVTYWLLGQGGQPSTTG